jgi:cation-transporting P-type ATPase 13A2
MSKPSEIEYLDPIQWKALRESKPKTAALVVLIILTGGLFYLPWRWSIKLQVLFYTTCSISEASHVRVAKKNSLVQIEKIQKKLVYDDAISKSKPHTKSIYLIILYNYETFYFDFEYQKFSPLVFDTKMSYAEIHGFEDGLNSDKIIKHRKKIFGECLINVPIPSILSTTIEQILKPWQVYQLFCVILWCTQEYYFYSMCILFVMMITLMVNIYYLHTNLKKIKKLATYICEVQVLRNNEKFIMSSINLVPGDVVYLTGDFLFPCDMILLKGFCLVDETMLTGESQPVIKESLPNIGTIYNKEKLYTLSNGTKIVSTNEESIAVVISTGYFTTKGDLVRSILFPKPNRFNFERDASLFIVFMFLIGVLGLSIAIPPLQKAGHNSRDILNACLNLVTTAVPAALPLTMAIGVGYSLKRFKHKHISCISPPCINASGRVSVLCFDKTGTLTQDEMKLGIVYDSSLLLEIDKLESCNIQFQKCMASCNSLTTLNGTLVGDPQEIAIVKALSWDVSQLNNGKILLTSPDGKNSVSRLFTYHFEPEIKRMGVIVQSDNRMLLYMKGAPEVLLPLCKDLPENTYETFLHYIRKGYRVLGCAYKVIEKFSENLKLDDIDHDLTFLGFPLLENPLKSDAGLTIDLLRAANIQCSISTGDNILTGLSVAKSLYMVTSDEVYLGNSIGGDIIWEKSDGKRILDLPGEYGFEVAVTGNLLEKLIAENHALLPFVIKNCKVYGRMSPRQKILLIQQFQETNVMVGMIGDGANDCGALKQADVGLSLSEAEASIAAPFCAKDLMKIVYILQEGRTSLVSSYHCFKFMFTYAALEFVCTVILYRIQYSLTNNQYIFFDVFTVLPLTFTMAASKPYPVLSKKLPPGSLVSVPIILSLAGNLFISITSIVIGYQILINQPWYNDIVAKQAVLKSSINYPAPTVETNVIFILGVAQLMALCFVYNVGKPFRQPVYYNLSFCAVVICLVIADLYLMMSRDTFTYNFADEYDEGHVSIRWAMAGIFIVSTFFSFVHEKLVVPTIVKVSRKYLKLYRH